jgi:hypothetical protein
VRAPRFGKLQRPARWSRVLIVHAMREFEREHGRRMVHNDLRGALPPHLPSKVAISNHFGSFRAACEAAYGDSRPQGGHREMAKDPDTELVIAELAAGRTLNELAAERGISGQALGRRLHRYQAAKGLPVVKRKPGPRKAA